MVIIAIFNIPPKMTLKQLVKTLGPIIKGYFEALNFTHSKGNKTAYIRLAEKLSAKDVIHRINCRKIGSHQVKAFIPDNLPNLPLAAKPKTLSAKQRRKLHIPPNDSPKELVNKSLDYIMKEVQTKYPQLYDLSCSTKHELLETIGQLVYQRVKEIIDDPNCENGTCFQVTKTYRKKHPHSTDFILILKTLHSIQDAQGKPRMQLQENQLAAIPQAAVFLMPYENLTVIVDSYIDRISKQLVGHVNGLEVTEQTSTAAEAAQMKVRKHLKDLGQHLPGMVRQVIMNHVVPADERYNIVKIYGEPFLPNKDIMAPFTQQFKPTSIIRSENMYNLISLKVHRNEYTKLLAADGHWIHGKTRLTIRPGKLPFHKVSRYLGGLSAENRPEEGATVDRQEDEMEWSSTW